jgi:hypothetical protein
MTRVKEFLRLFFFNIEMVFFFKYWDGEDETKYHFEHEKLNKRKI